MESRFNLILLIIIAVILASGATYFSTNWSPAEPRKVIAEELHGVDAHRAIVKQYEALGMRTSFREPMYNNQPVTSPDGKLTATLDRSFRQHFIKVMDNASGAVRYYVPDDQWENTSTLEEMGDLHFSPDGKRLAFSVYFYVTAANNDEVIGYALPGVFTIDLSTGKQNLKIYKHAEGPVRIIGMNDGTPITIEEKFTDANRPGEFPQIYTPFNYR